jgi:hypothetical protein
MIEPEIKPFNFAGGSRQRAGLKIEQGSDER